MKVTFVVSIDLDEGLIELDAKRRGRALAEVVSDCECRLVDSVRFRDGVQRVGSEVCCTAPSEVLQ